MRDPERLNAKEFAFENSINFVNNLFKGDVLAESPKSPQIGILRVLFLFENADIRCE